VIAEAMALGVPVIATDCSPGVRELLRDGAAGLIVPPDDPAALANAIQALLMNETLRQHLAGVGPLRTAEFGLEPGVARYERALAGEVDRAAR
jgi:glycosyltransferase involved in cell wall biosynthesis